MNKIQKAFQKAGKAFIPFITCGDPDLKTTENIVKAAVKNGADIIELGIPFSDPTAEGPVIQAANLRALNGGATADKIFDMVKRLRETVTIPLVFMTYANVVFGYGSEQFFQNCKEARIDGLILPDLPFEERGEFLNIAKEYNISLISMIAPTSENRIAEIASEAQGFIYIVSSLGVTGIRSEIKTDLKSVTDIVRGYSKIPFAIGFGISTPEQAKQMAALADGVIVGSAIIKLIEKHGEDSPKYVGEYVKSMKDAVCAAEISKQKRMGILGPAGTHSEAAAKRLLKITGENWLFTEYDEIHEAIAAVKDGRMDAAFVPVENSLEGSINVTLDILARSEELRITRELVWPVRNFLMAKCKKEEIKYIYSHPQPISQCFDYITKNFPRAEIIKVASTAKAAKMASEGKGTAAICAKGGGELNGLDLIAENIEDNPNNCTRFFEIQRSANASPSDNFAKTLAICQIDGRKAGSLCEMLAVFSKYNVNMTRIESRPARTELGDYIFFLELETVCGDLSQKALEEVKEKCVWIRNLGAFPVIDATKI